MCKRSAASSDPLLNAFLDKYHLNLLALPRENVDVGDVFIYDGKRTGSPGQLGSFLTKTFDAPPISRGEALAPLNGTLSNAVQLDAGVNLLEGFFAALGATIPIASVKADWKSKGVRNLRFKLDDARRDSIDVGKLGIALIGNSLRTDHPLYDGKNRYYVATAVARSKSLTLAFEDDNGKTINLGASVVATGNASVGVGITHSQSGEVTFAGTTMLAFGVETYELFVADDRIRLRLPDGAMRLRAISEAALPKPVFIGGHEADVFIDLATDNKPPLPVD